MVTQLILAGIVFQDSDYSPPTRMPFGGSQAMVVHKLPGGSRVIDTLGPDEDDISWSGFFFTPNALALCQQLDALCAGGLATTLTFAGMFRNVIIKRFKPSIRRFPHWIEYEISCTVTSNPSFGVLGGAVNTTGTGLPGGATASFDALISNDLSTALTATTE